MTDVPRVVTRVAHASHGDNRFRGFSVAEQLAGAEHWDLMSLAVGYRRLAKDEIAALNAMMACSLAADPRIFPLKVVRLVSSFGRFAPGVAAGYLMSDGGKIGPTTAAWSARMLLQLEADLEGAAVTAQNLRPVALARLRDGFRFPGFGVAFRENDERLPALRSLVQGAGRAQHHYWTLAHALDEVLRPEKIPMNLAACVAAGLLDIGFSVEQISVLFLPLLDANYIANAFEQSQEPNAALQCLPSDRVEYRGPEPRRSPRASGR